MRTNMADLKLLMMTLLLACDVISGTDEEDLSKRQNVINRRCFECHETDAPFQCLTLAKCGNGEICFTREFTDHNGKQGYHLGCEQKQRCQLFSNAATLLGKREAEDVEDDSNQCFECCDADDCNAHLCLGSLSRNNASHPGVGYTTGKCPPTFVVGPRSCFYMANWTLTWDNARLDCQRRGADLASVNDQAEDFFLVGLFNSVAAATHPNCYWLGGYYIMATKEWAWLDMARVQYTRWGPKEPTSSSYQYRIYMVNPASNAAYTDWMWASGTATSAEGFICERPFL
ncbi:uncharacterized protein LOC124275204 [Haliotis rubra]|uniref:uncharacterized protein LOC124275204 n=1 Tax=Haliotis rubra TaxID=36100 RepID=UPI001EE53DA6|nr:uncharacterized protein LOC124275204 [Haliotis rubra]